jgi:Ion channel
MGGEMRHPSPRIVVLLLSSSIPITAFTAVIVPNHSLGRACCGPRRASRRFTRSTKGESIGPTELLTDKTTSTFHSIDVDEVIDPEFLDKKLDENYDNDFDVNAFVGFVGGFHSCVVNYDKGGLAIPFVSDLDSESTWIEYGDDDGVVVPAGTVGQFKEIIANFLKEPRVEVAISFAVLICCALVAVSTIENMPYHDEFDVAESFISVVIAVEFFGRWFSSSKDVGRHVLSPQFALDVVVVVFPLVFGFMPAIDKTLLPAWITSPSALINLKLLRVLRLRRVLQDMETFVKFERSLGIRTSGIQEWQLQLARVLFSLFTLLSVSSGMIYTAEHGVNPAIPDYFTALYFGLVTMSTVGLGDIAPITWQGKLVVCGSILAGVAIIPAQAASLVEALLARQESKEQQKRTRGDLQRSRQNNLRTSIDSHDNGRMVLETSMQCPNCGSAMHWSSARFCWSCGEKLP